VELALQTFRLKRKGEKENQPLKDCTIGIIDVTEKTSKNVEEKSNPATNSFAFNLEPDKSYVVIASAPGYRPDTLAFNTLGIKKTTKVEKKFTLRLLRKEPSTTLSASTSRFVWTIFSMISTTTRFVRMPNQICSTWLI
jgi:hypothetical protein